MGGEKEETQARITFFGWCHLMPPPFLELAIVQAIQVPFLLKPAGAGFVYLPPKTVSVNILVVSWARLYVLS